MKFLSPNKNKVLSRAILIFLLLVAQFFLWPYVQELATRRFQARSQDRQLKEVQEKIAKLTEEINRQKEGQEETLLVVPGYEQKTRIIDRLESLALERGVGINIRTITDEKPVTDIIPLALDLQVIGESDQVLRYLVAVEHLPEITTVRNWALFPVAPPPGVTTSEYAMDMILIFYLQSVPAHGN
jgi:hypothetical protein